MWRASMPDPVEVTRLQARARAFGPASAGNPRELPDQSGVARSRDSRQIHRRVSRRTGSRRCHWSRIPGDASRQLQGPIHRAGDRRVRAGNGGGGEETRHRDVTVLIENTAGTGAPDRLALRRTGSDPLRWPRARRSCRSAIVWTRAICSPPDSMSPTKQACARPRAKSSATLGFEHVQRDSRQRFQRRARIAHRPP